jgi:hypothetical protein
MARVHVANSSVNDFKFMIKLVAIMVVAVKIIVEHIINRDNPCEIFRKSQISEKLRLNHDTFRIDWIYFVIIFSFSLTRMEL